MPLVTQIEQDIKAAMIARDETRLSVARLLKSAMKYGAIEKKIDMLTDADAQAVIQRQIKQRRESIEQFKTGGRPELVQKETAELEVLLSYLPKQLGDAELEALVQAEIKSAGSATKKDFGRLMKTLTEKTAGQTEPRRISELLGKLLP